jgi:hypothetical protein
MRKQASQKTLANTRKTPQPLRLRGFFIGGGGGSRTRNQILKSIDIAMFLVTHLQFHLQFTFPVSA